VQRVRSWHPREALVQVKETLQTSVLLILCRSRVRAPPAPPAAIRHIRCCLDGSWTGIVCRCYRQGACPYGHREQLSSGS
jgi:hypothetical protein